MRACIGAPPHEGNHMHPHITPGFWPASWDMTEAVGLFAGALTTLAFVPQVAKTWATRSARDFSLVMLVLFTLGLALWLVYGIMRGALSVVLANLVTLALASFILGMKLRRG
jgi:MtN3 and saliva related transmembrane protein